MVNIAKDSQETGREFVSGDIRFVMVDENTIFVGFVLDDNTGYAARD